MVWAWRRWPASGAATTEAPHGTEWLNFHFHPILEFELTWLFYTQGYIKPTLAITHSDVIGAPRGKWGAPCPCYTITTYYWHSSYTFSSPREGINSIGSLRTSDIIFFWCKWWHERRIYSGLMWQCKHDNCSKSSFCSPSPKLQLPVPSTHQ